MIGILGRLEECSNSPNLGREKNFPGLHQIKKIPGLPQIKKTAILGQILGMDVEIKEKVAKIRNIDIWDTQFEIHGGYWVGRDAKYRSIRQIYLC